MSENQAKRSLEQLKQEREELRKLLEMNEKEK